MHKLLMFSEFLYNLSIIAMGYAAYTNVVDYRVAIIFVLLIIGIIFSISPSLLKEAGVIKHSGKYSDFDMALKFIMWVQTLYLAHGFFLFSMVINIICMPLAIFCKVKICNEIEGVNISVADAIDRIKKLDSSYIDPHNPFIIGNFLVITIFMSFHENIIGMIVSVAICIVYFGIGIFRLWKNGYISKRDIVVLSVIDLALIILSLLRLRLLACILWAEFYSKMRDGLKKMAIAK